MKSFTKIVISILLVFLCSLEGGYVMGSEITGVENGDLNNNDDRSAYLYWGIITAIGLIISIGFHFLLRFKKRSMEEKGAVTEDERMFEPFYGADFKERIGVIVSVALLGSLPLVIIYTLFSELPPPWNSLFIGGAAVLLLLLVGLYTVILFKKSRDFYNQYEIILMPVIFFLLFSLFLSYLISLDEFGVPEQFRVWSVAVSFYSIAAIAVGVKLLLSANRTIYDKKAKAEDELNFASEVQQQFLNDRIVKNDTISAFGTSRAAREVGGDFLYLQELGDQSVVAAVGDVSGHSFGAGLIMSMLITMTEDHMEFIESPVGLMENLNRKLLNQPKRNLFATMGCIQLDKDNATFWNAGHMPVLKYSPSEGHLTKVKPPGFALGMTKQAEYKPTQVSLSPGDYLVLYSDGLVETRDKEDQIRDEKHFYGIVESVLEKKGAVKTVAKSVLEKVLEDDYSSYPEDDLTIVVIHKKG